MGTEHEAALEVLREVWRGQGQSAADLDEVGIERSCQRMTGAGVGFADFAAEAGENADLAAAWRARLAREGKLSGSGVSVRDLVLGQAEPRCPPSRTREPSLSWPLTCATVATWRTAG